ncbi:MAG: pilus assembly protein [Acidimicrobiia bacterium]|nr:pilus assembly protein [Acidimicrobiia bacterium]
MTTITVSVVLLATMLVVQFGLAYYAQQVLAGAAQDGAANGARRDSTPEAGRLLAEDLVDQAGASLLTNRQADVEVRNGRVVVSMRGEVVSLIPFRRSITVEASGSAPTEEFRPQRTGT